MGGDPDMRPELLPKDHVHTCPIRSGRQIVWRGSTGNCQRNVLGQSETERHDGGMTLQPF